MKCAKCDFDKEEILSVIDNGIKRVVLCPNHTMGIVLEAYTFEEIEGEDSTFTPSAKCDCCDQKAIYFKDSKTEYQVCSDHVIKLLKYNLSPSEWMVLSAKYGKNAFLLHDDFYDEVGNAMQPIK